MQKELDDVKVKVIGIEKKQTLIQVGQNITAIARLCCNKVTN